MLYERSDCPISASLDLIGDKWTLIIIRDLLLGKHKFSEFLHSPEHITTNILTDRLKRLEQAGLLTTEAYSERPLRHAYHLTPKGRALHPVLQALCHWGNTHLPGTWIPPESFMQPSDPSLDREK